MNQAAKQRFMSGGQCSIDRGANAAWRRPERRAQHHNARGLAGSSGLNNASSNPSDAYILFKAAVADPDPVIFVENKTLYAMAGELAADVDTCPIGRARVARPGRDVTVVSYGASVHTSLAAAQSLQGAGIEAESSISGRFSRGTRRWCLPLSPGPIAW
jgi:pyruvate dehydrogenase E1 component beta subunit